MAELPPVPSTLRIRLNGLYQGRTWNAIQHWKYVGAAPSSAQIVTICSGFMTAWNTAFASQHHTTASIVSVDGWDLTSPGSNFGNSAVGGSSGTLIGTALPVSIACVTTWKVNYRWKGGHPRTYWPAGDTSKVQNGRTWLAAFVTSMSTASGSYLSAVNGLTAGALSGSLVAVRRVYTDQNHVVQKFDPPLTLPITGGVVDARLDTQRRRLGPDVPA